MALYKFCIIIIIKSEMSIIANSQMWLLSVVIWSCTLHFRYRSSHHLWTWFVFFLFCGNLCWRLHLMAATVQ